MASKLYVGGLSYSTTSEGLREFFAQSGNILSATVITDRFSGQSRGFGFVEMNTAEEAQNAISQLNGLELDGRRISVEISMSPPKGPEWYRWIFLSSLLVASWMSRPVVPVVRIR